MKNKIRQEDLKNVGRTVLAWIYGVHPTTINKREKAGMPRNGNGKFNLKMVNQWWENHLKAKYSQPTETDPDSIQWLRRYRKERALKSKIERKALEKKYVPIAEIQRVGFEAGKQVKEGCLAIPDRCASLVAASSDTHECKMILTKEITYILENLANALAVLK